MATTVSRRLVYVKRTKNPHAPLPRKKPQAEADPMIGEKAKPFAMLAAAPRPQAKEAGWLKFVKPALLVSGIAAFGGVFAMMGGGTKSYSDTSSAEVRTVTAAATRRPAAPSQAAKASAYPGAQESVTPVLSQRAAPTDQSFLQTAYVRKKVSLDDISGNCTVKGGGSRDVADCLRRAAGQ